MSKKPFPLGQGKPRKALPNDEDNNLINEIRNEQFNKGREQGKKDNLLTAKRYERSLTKKVRKEILEEVYEKMSRFTDKEIARLEVTFNNKLYDVLPNGKDDKLLVFPEFRLKQQIAKLSGEALSTGKSQKRGSKLKEVD